MLWEQGPSSYRELFSENKGKGETAGVTPHQEINCLPAHCAEMGLPGHHCLMHSENRDDQQSDWNSQAPQEWAPVGQYAAGTLHFSPGKNLFILSLKTVKSGNLDMHRSSCFILWDTHFAHTHSQTHIHAYTHTHLHTSIFTYEEELMTTGKISHCQLLLVKKFLLQKHTHTASNFFQSLM